MHVQQWHTRFLEAVGDRSACDTRPDDTDVGGGVLLQLGTPLLQGVLAPYRFGDTGDAGMLKGRRAIRVLLQIARVSLVGRWTRLDSLGVRPTLALEAVQQSLM